MQNLYLYFTADSNICRRSFCSISRNIREGLLEVFYGVYEKDPEKVVPILVSEYGVCIVCYLINYVIHVLCTAKKGVLTCSGSSSNGPDGRSSAYRRYDSGQTNSSLLPQQVSDKNHEVFTCLELKYW